MRALSGNPGALSWPLLHVLDLVARHASAIVAGHELSLLFRRATTRKAVGPSLVPPEFLNAAPRDVAALLEPLALKMGMNICVPIQWQGADVALIPTQPLGSIISVENRRDILLADLTINAVTARLMKRVAPRVSDCMVATQHGAGFCSASCPLAHLVVRTAVDLARAQSCAHASLFVDIRAAFASIVKQLVLPGISCTRHHVETLLAARGFPKPEAEDIVSSAPHIISWGSAAPHFRHMVGALSRHQQL
jgi:hypothetical protein